MSDENDKRRADKDILKVGDLYYMVPPFMSFDVRYHDVD
jgi:hypothetical protein